MLKPKIPTPNLPFDFDSLDCDAPSTWATLESSPATQSTAVVAECVHIAWAPGMRSGVGSQHWGGLKRKNELNSFSI